MTLAITGLYAAPLVLVYLVLTTRVITYRRSAKVSLGDGDDPALRARIRAHGNFAEFAPLGLILLLIAEVQATSAVWLHVLGCLLLAGRLLHGVNFSFGLRLMPLRVGGMILTLLALGLGAVLALPV